MGYSKYPLVHGHEIVGIVKEVRTNVHGFKTRDHVGVGTYVNSCRDCEYCNDGVEVHCSKGSVLTFNAIDADDTITKGGYSSYIVVHERYCYKISEDYLFSFSCAIVMCWSHCYTSTVRNKMDQPGKSLRVAGLGGLGYIAELPTKYIRKLNLFQFSTYTKHLRCSNKQGCEVSIHD